MVGINGTHWAMKVGSVDSTVSIPVCSAAMASVAALTAAVGSVVVVAPVLPPDGVAVPEGDALDDGVELVLAVAGCDVEAALVATFVVLLVVVDEDASVCWSVWYWAIAAVYVALSARTAFCSGVALIDANASPAVTVSPALTLTPVTVPLVGKLTLACVTWWTVPDSDSTWVTVPAAAVTVRYSLGLFVAAAAL